MRVFDFIPLCARTIDLAEAYKVNAREVAENSDLHYETVRNCFRGSPKTSVETYIRWCKAVESVVAKRREKLEAYNRAFGKEKK